MSTHAHSAVTRGACVLCGGSCREPLVIEPVPDEYPFMSQAAKDALRAHHAELVPKPPAKRRNGRARHLIEDRAHHPGEDR